MPDPTDNVLCFSYGSNMSSRYLRQFCPSATAVMTATLPNAHIEFRRFSTDLNGGISTIVEAPGEIVHGILYMINGIDIDHLDLLEDVAKGLYVRETYLVLGKDNTWHSADLYRAGELEDPFEPAPQYISWMVEGAREHGLPPDYITEIEGFSRSNSNQS